MDKYIKFSDLMEYLRNRNDEARRCGHEETYFDLLTIINGLRNVETIPASALGKDIDVPVKWIPVSERLPEISEKDVYGNVTFSKPVWACMKYGDGFTWQGIDQYTTNNGGGWLSEVPFDDPEECSKVLSPGCHCLSRGKENRMNEVNIVTVRWWDGYMETFECSEVRFGSDLLWMRLVSGQNRHIPVKYVRWYSMSRESHEPVVER